MTLTTINPAVVTDFQKMDGDDTFDSGEDASEVMIMFHTLINVTAYKLCVYPSAYLMHYRRSVYVSTGEQLSRLTVC
jgi:hypothetical protein